MQRVSPFTFFGTMRLFQKSHFSSEIRRLEHILKTLDFFSRRYSTGLRRSRLV